MFRRPTVALAAAAIACGSIVGLSAAFASRTPSGYGWYDPLVDVREMVRADFVTEPDDQALLEGAISGMLQALNDPYTEYIPPADIKEFDKQTRGEFVGIGAEVRTENGFLTIISPLEDSPAYKAGVLAGDKVTAVDGVSTLNKTVFECIDMLAGEPGTPVVVTIERGGQTFDLTITRDRIVTQTVKGVHRVENDAWDFWIDPERRIAYVRLTQFTPSSTEDIARTLGRLVDQGLSGLVLDLRFNPGGLLPSAIEIADLFLKEGVIVSTKGRAHPEQKFSARSGATLPDFPVAVLVNRQSASASEILAGALADNGRAVVVGERTFGKGSVQKVVPLPSGAGQLKITEQHYYLPSGRSIHRRDDSEVWGVDPTPGFYVPMTDAEVGEMLRIRREEEIIRPRDAAPRPEQDWSNPAWIQGYLKDAQLAAGVEAVRRRLDTGAWVPVGAALPDAAISQDELRRLELTRERIMRELSRIDRRVEALASAGADADKARDTLDLIPGEPDLTGGRLTITDAQGNPVATLNITGADLERWLLDAPVAKPAP